MIYRLTLVIFERRLDSFWCNQECKYNYKSDLNVPEVEGTCSNILGFYNCFDLRFNNEAKTKAHPTSLIRRFVGYGILEPDFKTTSMYTCPLTMLDVAKIVRHVLKQVTIREYRK